MISRTKPDFTAPTGGKAPVGGLLEGYVLDYDGTAYAADATALPSGLAAASYLEDEPTAVLITQQEGYGICGAAGVTKGDWLSAEAGGTGKLDTSVADNTNIVVSIAKSTGVADDKILVRIVSPFVLPNPV